MRLEPILKAKVAAFQEDKDFTQFDEDTVFEYFVNYHILYSQQPDLFFGNTDILNVVSTGGSNDMAIDGIAFKVNGCIISSIDDFEEIRSGKAKIQIELIFIQSKNKKKLSMGEFNNFSFGIREFLSDELPQQPYNKKIEKLLKIKEHILNDKYISQWQDNPIVSIYYVTIGEHSNIPHVDALVSKLKDDIAHLNIYDNVNINLIDSPQLKKLCDSNENSFNISLNFIEDMGLNAVESVDNSCVILCFANEFIKIIRNDNKSLRKTIFNDNVRDFQGDTTINNEIRKTIECDPEKFVLLNNGITIVCDKFTPRNRTINISNPQIVNGCQSSSVIYHADKSGYDMSKVPLLVKIISTTDSDVANQIVRGTNRQNIVYDEAFEITREFHKNLEMFFEAKTFNEKKYYYERRSRQFQHNTTIKQYQKISFKNIIQSCVGLFFYRPDLAHVHESRLLKLFQNKIFLNSQSLFPYYVAGIMNNLIENFFKVHSEQRKIFYTYKFHILMIASLLADNSTPSINVEKSIDNKCSKIEAAIANNGDNIFYNAIETFKKCSIIWTKDLLKSQHGLKDTVEFVELIIKNISDKPLDFLSDVQYGRVRKVSIDRHGKYFGFIEFKPNDVFFHEQNNKSLNYEKLLGKTVSFRLIMDKVTGNLTATEVAESGDPILQ